MAKKLTYKDLEGNIIYVDKVDALTAPVQEVTLYQELGDDENGAISQKALTEIINNIEIEETFTQVEADELYQPIGDYVEGTDLAETLEDFITKEEADETYQVKGEYLTQIPDTVATKEYVDEKFNSFDDSIFAKKEDLNNYQEKGEYLTEIPEEYVKRSELDPYALKTDIPTNISQLQNDKGYTDVEDVEAIVAEKIGDAETISEKLQVLQESFNELSNDFNTVEGSIANKANVGDSYSKAESDSKYLQAVPEEYAKKSDLPVVPKKVSDLEQDINYITEIPSEYALKTDIPTVPNKVSAFENDAKYVSENDLEGYAKKSDLPVVPTKVSELENDLQYLREHQSLDNYYTKIEANSLHAEMERGFANTYTRDEIDSEFVHKGEVVTADNFYNKSQADARFQPVGNYLTEHQSLSDYAKVSDLENYQKKGNYLTEHQSLENYFTKEEANNKFQPVGNYLTQHQSLENYYSKAEADGKFLTEHQPLSEYLTKAEAEVIFLKEHQDLSALLRQDVAFATFQLKGNYLTEHQDLTPYLKSEDAEILYQPSGDYVLSSDLANYYSKQQVNNYLLKNYYDKTDVDAMHKTFEEHFTLYYTKLETETLIRLMIQNLAPQNICYSKVEADDRFAHKSTLINFYYTKTEIDSMLISSGNGEKVDMSKYATVEYVEDRLKNIDVDIDTSKLLTKEEAESLYVKIGDVITEDDLQEWLDDNHLIDFSEYYTKREIDAKIENIQAGEGNCSCEEIEAITEQEIRNLLNN